MNTFLLLADISSTTAITIAAAVGTVLVLVLGFRAFASRYVKVGPNQVLVVSGVTHKHTDPDGTVHDRGFRIVKGGSAFIIPVLEKVDVLSLELLTIDVQTPEVYTSKGVPVKVDGVAQIKIKGDDISIATAAEQVLSKSIDEIKSVATQTLEGHLRAILGTMTVEDIYQNRDAFASKVQEVAAGDMANMGLSIVSFTIRDIRDGQGYLDALGKPRIAHEVDLNNDIHYKLQCFQATHGSSMRGISLARSFIGERRLPRLDRMTDASERFPHTRILEAIRRAADRDSLKVIIDWS